MVDRSECDAPVARDVDPRHRSAPALLPVEGDEPVDQRPPRHLLQLGIERGADRKPACVELFLAVLRKQRPPHFLGEELRRRDVGAELTRIDAQVLLLGFRRHGFVEVPVLHHLVEDPVAALLGAALGRLRLVGMVVVRRLRQRGEIRRLVRLEILELFVEVVQRRRRDAIRVEPEEDLVEIKLEDLVLRIRALDPDRENGFLDLALERAVVGQQEVFRHLLGDGRGALGAPVGALEFGFRKLEYRAPDALKVEAAMLIEALVLGRQERPQHLLGDRIDRHENPPLARELGDQRPVVGVNARHHRRLVLGQAVVIRQVLRRLPQEVAGDRRADQEHHHARGKRKAEKAQQPALTPLALPSRIDRGWVNWSSHAPQGPFEGRF